MKQRLADYVADFLAARGVTDVFSVVGGGAMHLNDALGHHPKLHVTYNHHEQACAMAAEAYARLDNRIAAVCVTTGPGGTNALTGVAGGWLDSIPMFIVSGQVRYDTTARYALPFTETPLRAARWFLLPDRFPPPPAVPRCRRCSPCRCADPPAVRRPRSGAGNGSRPARPARPRP